MLPSISAPLSWECGVVIFVKVSVRMILQGGWKYIRQAGKIKR
jgi:hypothetical protein